MGNLLESIKNTMMWSGVVSLALLVTLLSIALPHARSATLLSSHSLFSTKDQHRDLSKRLGEESTLRQAWLVLLPFQNAPGPNTHGPDPQEMKPFYKRVPPKRGVAHLAGIGFDRCLDTDTCVLIIAQNETSQGREILVQLFGTDIPRLRGTCEQEKALATNALELLQQVLSEATQIDVYDHYKVGGKHMARVVADGQDLSQLLIDQGLAVHYGGVRKDWCNE